jgi:AraC-like DNA-binding protein
MQASGAGVDWVFRRAGGRRRYNALRHSKQLHRRVQVADLLDKYGWPQHGSIAAIARELGVHRSTVLRDLQALHRLSRPCPRCGQLPVRRRMNATEVA